MCMRHFCGAVFVPKVHPEASGKKGIRGTVPEACPKQEFCPRPMASLKLCSRASSKSSPCALEEPASSMGRSGATLRFLCLLRQDCCDRTGAGGQNNAQGAPKAAVVRPALSRPVTQGHNKPCGHPESDKRFSRPSCTAPPLFVRQPTGFRESAHEPF